MLGALYLINPVADVFAGLGIAWVVLIVGLRLTIGRKRGGSDGDDEDG
jgi:hypothetical protein